MAFLFEDLEAYKRSMSLAKETFILSEKIKDKAINDQLHRAVLSVPLNIAEGQGRFHEREKKQFYRTAKGSLYECVPLIQICFHMGYIDQGKYDQLYALANEVSKILAGLIKSVGK